MKTRNAQVSWKGDLKNGTGELNIKSIGCKGNFSFMSRFEEGKGTNPEELIAAAHAGCFSMALANLSAEKGYTPDEINTTAHVSLVKGDKGFYISGIKLVCKASIPGIDTEKFQELATDAKKNCPVSKALSAVDISLEAELVGN